MFSCRKRPRVCCARGACSPGKSVLMTNAIVVPLALFLSACSSIDPRSAAKLAEQGAAVSLDASSLYAERERALERYLEGECMMAALADGYSPPGDAMIESVDSVERSMRIRRHLFAKLAETYKAFERLALYDDDGKLDASIRSLSDAVNEGVRAVGAKSAVSKNDTDLAALAGRRLFRAFHKSEIADASRVIRGQLERILAILSNPGEKRAILATERAEGAAKLRLALVLWRLGLALPDDIVDEHVKVYGLIPNKSSTMRQSDRLTTGRMRDAVTKILSFRDGRENRGRENAYNAVMATLKNLISAHEALESGSPPSFDSFSRDIREIREYSRLLKERAEKP